MPCEISTTAQWKARPVFVSSTFKDMQAERSYLQSHVFPRLEEKLRERRHQFEPIDLRLGVETAELGTEEARELLVLKVCLEEIQRSRPFIIVILGDRYGWVPPPERMETAAREAGFKTEVLGKSVTALEIEFGLREAPDQSRRSFFYFREPLPYDRMPPEIAAQYSDAFSPDPAVRAGHDKLEQIKLHLSTDAELRPHIHLYHAKWDDATQRVTGLDAWGEMVFQHLWAVLDEETRDFASLPPKTWEQREHAALAEFIAQRRRDFTGREALITQLLDNARSPAAEGVTWGACVTGSPGSGKSALMAELYQRLAKGDSMLILANAAGATPRGTEPDAMLRRFIGELAAALGIADPLPKDAKADEVDATFAFLLARSATQIRVVVLLDALDQFDSTPRGQHLSWLRALQWPRNARLIATGITGSTPVKALIKHEGVEELELPALAAPDVTEIAKRVWARYHRQVNPEVLRVLAEKKLPDGTPACGNPLWLTLALEQLNLLDADDFARAEQEFSGSPAERLRALLLDTATRMPPNVPSLYGWLLEQTENTYGAPYARAFAVLIASGRFGWRETDLIKLIPRVARLLYPMQTIPALKDLALASIRRGFRSHLVRRGASGQLDFFHAQMRDAVQARSLHDTTLLKAIHGIIVDHLEALPMDDPLRVTEMMAHLIGHRNRQRAARYFAQLVHHGLGSNTRMLRELALPLVRLLEAPITNHEDESVLEWLVSVIRDSRHGYTNHMIAFGVFCLDDMLEERVSAPTNKVRMKLLEALQTMTLSEYQSEKAKLERMDTNLTNLWPFTFETQATFDARRDGIADLRIRQECGLVVMKSAVSTVIQRKLIAIYSHFDLEGAREANRKAYCYSVDFDNARQHRIEDITFGSDLSCFGHMIDALNEDSIYLPPALQALFRDGELLLEMGQYEDAIKTFSAVGKGVKRVWAFFDPAAEKLAAGCLLLTGDALLVSGKTNEAAALCTEARKLLEVAFSRIVENENAEEIRTFPAGTSVEEMIQSSLDDTRQKHGGWPSSNEWCHLIAIAHRRTGNAWLACGQHQVASDEYRCAMMILSELLLKDPGNHRFELSMALVQLAAAKCSESTGSWLDASRQIEESVVVLSSHCQRNADGTWLEQSLADALTLGEKILVKLGDNEGAAHFRQARNTAPGTVASKACVNLSEETGDVWARADAQYVFSVMAWINRGDLDVQFQKCDTVENGSGSDPDYYQSFEIVQPSDILFEDGQGLTPVYSPSIFGAVAPSPRSDPTIAALALLSAGQGSEAMEVLRPLVFPNYALEMDQGAPLEARLAFVRALWLTQNHDGVLMHLPRLREQDDPRVQSLRVCLEGWQKNLSWMQKLGFGKKPPLPTIPST